MSKTKYNQIKKHVAKTGNLDKKHYTMLCELHAKVYTHKYFEPCTCSPATLKGWIMDLDKYYKKTK